MVFGPVAMVLEWLFGPPVINELVIGIKPNWRETIILGYKYLPTGSDKDNQAIIRDEKGTHVRLGMPIPKSGFGRGLGRCIDVVWHYLFSIVVIKERICRFKFTEDQNLDSISQIFAPNENQKDAFLCYSCGARQNITFVEISEDSPKLSDEGFIDIEPGYFFKETALKKGELLQALSRAKSELHNSRDLCKVLNKENQRISGLETELQLNKDAKNSYKEQVTDLSLEVNDYQTMLLNWKKMAPALAAVLESMDVGKSRREREVTHTINEVIEYMKGFADKKLVLTTEAMKSTNRGKLAKGQSVDDRLDQITAAIDNMGGS